MGYKKEQKSRGKKGDISIENHRGRIRLRWRYNSIRYPLNLPYDYTPENIHKAELIAGEIKLDIMKGVFDTTLKKYEVGNANPEEQIPPPPKLEFIADLKEHFNTWCSVIRNVNVEKAVDYFSIRRWLIKQKKVHIHQLPLRLNAGNWAPSTYNRRMTYLRTFIDWLIESKMVETNPLSQVRKMTTRGRTKRKQRAPLNGREIKKILDAFNNNEFCSKYSNPKHSFYYPFVAFIVYTGVRNAEAIGLQVKHIDFKNNVIEISSTLARTTKGTHHAARVRKSTKNEMIRYLKITDELKVILIPQVDGKGPEDLVFHSPRGKSINDDMFQKRIFKPLLKHLNIEDRDLYSLRHSVGVRAVEQHMALTDLAGILGHRSINTAVRNYVAIVKKLQKLPQLFTQQ